MKASLGKNGILYSKMLPYPPFPTRSPRHFFPQYLLWLSCWAPRQISQYYGGLYDWSFKLSEISALSLQQFTNYYSDFPTFSSVPEKVSAHESVLGSARTTCFCLLLSPILGAVVCPVFSHFSYGSQKSCWFYLSVQLKVRTEQWLPRSLCAEPEARRQK